MDRGLYTAASGGLARTRELDIVSNNLANVNTVGFKAQRIITHQQSFSDTLASTLSDNDPSAQGDFDRTPGVVTAGTVTDFSQGPIRNTENPLDVALTQPNTFFVVNTPEGETYTRAGNFTLDAERNLVTADGMAVSGGGGQITLPPGKVTIRDNGAITVEGEQVAALRVVRIDDLKSLERTDGARFKLAGGGQAEGIDNPRVIPGAVEMPNFNVVEAMVQMIDTQRAFESYQKSVRTIDELNEESLRVARR
ncbi:MAG: flagellar hook-basal body protein [Bdellovibrionales bacterium]|nr:flagellar hook-basal body protein [Bdellovibrionales bacterium]